MYAEELYIFKSCIFLQYETRYSSLLSCIWWESKSCVSITYNIELLRLATFKISFSFPQTINHKKVKPEANGTQYVYAGLTFMNMHPGSLDQVLWRRKTTLSILFSWESYWTLGMGMADVSVSRSSFPTAKTKSSITPLTTTKVLGARLLNDAAVVNVVEFASS